MECLLDYVLQVVWPNGSLIKANPQTIDSKTQEDMLSSLRKSNASELLSRLPAGLLSNSFGDGQVLNYYALLLFLLNILCFNRLLKLLISYLTFSITHTC